MCVIFPSIHVSFKLLRLLLTIFNSMKIFNMKEKPQFSYFENFTTKHTQRSRLSYLLKPSFI